MRLGNFEHGLFGERILELIRNAASFFCALAPVGGVINYGRFWHVLGKHGNTWSSSRNTSQVGAMPLFILIHLIFHDLPHAAQEALALSQSRA
jgi:hypothetical protein